MGFTQRVLLEYLILHCTSLLTCNNLCRFWHLNIHYIEARAHPQSFDFPGWFQLFAIVKTGYAQHATVQCLYMKLIFGKISVSHRICILTHARSFRYCPDDNNNFFNTSLTNPSPMFLNTIDTTCTPDTPLYNILTLSSNGNVAFLNWFVC